jgi:hypothetical protein
MPRRLIRALPLAAVKGMAARILVKIGAVRRRRNVDATFGRGCCPIGQMKNSIFLGIGGGVLGRFFAALALAAEVVFLASTLPLSADTAPAPAAAAPVASTDVAELTARFARLPVQYNGRLQPVDTVARNTLLILGGKQEVRLSPEQASLFG